MRKDPVIKKHLAERFMDFLPKTGLYERKRAGAQDVLGRRLFNELLPFFDPIQQERNAMAAQLAAEREKVETLRDLIKRMAGCDLTEPNDELNKEAWELVYQEPLSAAGGEG